MLLKHRSLFIVGLVAAALVAGPAWAGQTPSSSVAAIHPSPHAGSGIASKKKSAKDKLWVVPVRWSDGESTNPDTVTAMVDEAVRFYRAESNGALNLTSTTLPVETAARTCTPPASSLSRKVAQENPRIGTGADVVVLVFPPLGQDCDNTIEGIGGESDYAWNLAACWDGAEDARCLEHELGHALFTLNHDNLIRCQDSNGQPISYGGTCVLEEYHDPYSVMGNGPYGAGLPVDYLITAGFRPSSSAVYAATSTTVTLSPRSSSSGTLMAVVPLLNRGGRGGSRSQFQLEYRTATGTDAWLGDPSAARSENPGTGVLVSLVGDSPYAELEVPMTSFGDPLDRGLINMHPEAQHLTPGMQAGDSWAAPDGSVRISVVSETPDAAVVRIDHARDTTAPYPFKVDRPSTFSLGRKSRVFINFDTPGDNVAVKRFKIKLSGRPAFYVSGDKAVQRVSQGEVMRVLPPGRYKVQVVAEDYSGNQTRSNTKSFVVR